MIQSILFIFNDISPPHLIVVCDAFMESTQVQYGIEDLKHEI